MASRRRLFQFSLPLVISAGLAFAAYKQYRAAPIVHLDRDLGVLTSSRDTLRSEVGDSGARSLTFSWTQVEGPKVTLEFSDTPNVSFLTPAEECRLVLRLTVSNGAAITSREAVVRVISFLTEWRSRGMEVGYEGEGHNSDLRVVSTSMRPGFIWGRADTQLEISFAASDGVVLVDSTDPIEPLAVYLENSKGPAEVTDFFRYSPTENKLSLDPTRIADFRALLRDHPMQLLISGGDSVGTGVQIYVPLLNGRFQILGSTLLAPGTIPEPLAGTIVTLAGNKLGLTATTTLDSQGGFSFDNLPRDNYNITILTPRGLLGTAFAALREGINNTVYMSLELFSASTTTSMSLAAGAKSDMASLQAGNAESMQATASHRIEPPLAKRSPGHGPPYTDRVYADSNKQPPGSAEIAQATIFIPKGARSVVLAYRVGPAFDSGDPFRGPNPPCGSEASGVADHPFFHGFLLSGQLVWHGSHNYCDVIGTGWHKRNLNVSAATMERDAELRIVVAAGNAGWASTYGASAPFIAADAQIGTEFIVITGKFP